MLAAPGHALGQVCHYIHLNPVRAGLCKPDTVLSYAASSLSKLVSRNRPDWLDGSTVLAESGSLPDSPAGWKRYVAYLEFLAEDALARKELVAPELAAGGVLATGRSRRT